MYSCHWFQRTGIIDHIKDVAYVIDDLADLKAEVSDALLREEKQKKSHDLAMKEHDISKICLKVCGILEDAIVG